MQSTQRACAQTTAFLCNILAIMQVVTASCKQNCPTQTSLGALSLACTQDSGSSCTAGLCCVAKGINNSHKWPCPSSDRCSCMALLARFCSQSAFRHPPLPVTPDCQAAMLQHRARTFSAAKTVDSRVAMLATSTRYAFPVSPLAPNSACPAHAGLTSGARFLWQPSCFQYLSV